MQKGLSKIIDYLFSLHRFGIKPGLERTLALAEIAGNPHTRFKTIHVAGTNGKGSTCSMLASILQEAGFKTGLYTSPHILRFNERIRVNGAMISDEDMVRHFLKLEPHIEEIGSTFFEVTTVMAFSYFAEQNVDIAVIETGLGGRLDSTNIIAPELSVITSIDLDHMEYLGTTLPKIAFEKAGIIKKNTPVIVAENRAELRGVFEKKADEEDAPITFLKDIFVVENVVFKKDFSTEIYFKNVLKNEDSLKITTSLAGKHQVQNALTAFAAIEVLKEKVEISDVAIEKGFKNVKQNVGLRGRIELLKDNPPLVVDVAHNPAGTRVLKETLDLCGYSAVKWNLVFGAMADKDIAEMLTPLKDIAEEIFAAAPKNERAAKAEKIGEIARESGFKNVNEFESIEEAVEAAFKKDAPMLICGSFYVVDEAFQALKEHCGIEI
ncbi:MAG: folylpolyglutamate synthase/dihydrofolate synthase family protein [Bacteroidota bacterium]